MIKWAPKSKLRSCTNLHLNLIIIIQIIGYDQLRYRAPHHKFISGTENYGTAGDLIKCIASLLFKI